MHNPFQKGLKGSTILEYAILLMIIAIVAIVLVGTIGSQIENSFSNTTSNLQADNSPSVDTGAEDNTDPNDPWIPIPSTTVPEEEIPFMETLDVYPSCNVAYWDGNHTNGFYRLRVNGNEYTVYCLMYDVSGNYLQGGWTLTVHEYESDAVQWLSGKTPIATSLNWPDKSYTLAWDQIPEHEHVAFGGQPNYRRPTIQWPTRGITLFDIFAPRGENKVWYGISHINGIYGGGSIAKLYSIPAETCNYGDTINYYGYYDGKDEQTLDTLAFREQFRPFIDGIIRERTAWQFSPNHVSPAHRGACWGLERTTDFFLQDDPNQSWSIFVR